jgi:hypothetical protein
MRAALRPTFRCSAAGTLSRAGGKRSSWRAIANRFNQQGEGLRRLAAAGIVKVIPKGPLADSWGILESLAG